MMPAMPALAVIIRALGPGRVRDALDSLACQTNADFEAVIVDMSAGSLDPVVAAARRLPGLVHVRVGRRLSRPHALNTGIARSRAPAISILDDDNLYGPEHIQTLLRGLAATQADLVFTPVRRQTLTPDGVLLGEERHAAAFSRARLLFGNYIFATGTAFTRDIWRRVGGYDRRFQVYEDWEFLIRVADAGRIAAIEGDDAIVRNFTGDAAVFSHNRELSDCVRCTAGLFWKHRRRYSDALFDEHPELAAGNPGVPRGGYQSGSARVLIEWYWDHVRRLATFS
jgi:hypothetical protein